jgi:transcription elongation factor GreA
MMKNNETFLTAEGAAKLRDDLEYLKNEKRTELSKRLRHAISMGDLSENADYIATKEEQAFLEGKIQELEATLRAATIIENSGQSDRIEVGSVVRVSEEGGDSYEYQIVGAKEADPRNGKISNESPIGQALLGKRKDDAVLIRTPSGETTYKILEILAK